MSALIISVLIPVQRSYPSGFCNRYSFVHCIATHFYCCINIAGGIVDYAEENDINLIVIGTRGRSGFKKLLLGSVASHVVTYAHCPILVVK